LLAEGKEREADSRDEKTEVSILQCTLTANFAILPK